jgi:hypothetical protein
VTCTPRSITSAQRGVSALSDPLIRAAPRDHFHRDLGRVRFGRRAANAGGAEADGVALILEA